jgi:hypothetical protein
LQPKAGLTHHRRPSAGQGACEQRGVRAMELPPTLRAQYLMRFGSPVGCGVHSCPPPLAGILSPCSFRRMLGATTGRVYEQARGVHEGVCCAERRVGAVTGLHGSSQWDSEGLETRPFNADGSLGVVSAERKRIIIPHADEAGMEDDGLNYLGHMLAGSIAGMSEHAFMFPADTVKTRMQVSAQRQQPQYKSVFSGFSTIIKTEGIAGLYRYASSALALACLVLPSNYGVRQSAPTARQHSCTAIGMLPRMCAVHVQMRALTCAFPCVCVCIQRRGVPLVAAKSAQGSRSVYAPGNPTP